MTRSYRRRFSAVLVLVLLTVGLAACGDSGDSSSEDANSGGSGGSAEPTTATIGFIAPLSGPAAPAMKPLEDGARAAIEYLNSGNAKAQNVTYELEVRDSGGDPNKDAVLIRELIDAGIDMVIGDTGSAPGFIAEQTAVNDAEIPAFTSGPSDAIWGDAGEGKRYPWAFGINGNDTMFVTPVYEAATELTSAGTIGQIYMDAGSIPGWAELTEELASEDVELASASFAPQATDVKSQLRELQGSGADTLIVWAFGAQLQLVLNELDQLGWYPEIVTLSDAGRASLQEAVPERVMEKVVAGPIAATFASEDGQAPAGSTNEFLEALSGVTGRGDGEFSQTDITAAYTFDIIVAYDAAIAEAGSTDGPAVREALESGMVVEGAMGPHSWSPTERSGFKAESFAMFDPRQPCSSGTCVRAGED